MTKLTLVLAHGPEQPHGDIEDRLVLELRLTQQGQIDAASYDAAETPWLARREQNGTPPREMELIRIDEGWALQSTDSLDDPVWGLEGYIFRPGELVRIGRPDGGELLYRIVASQGADRA